MVNWTKIAAIAGIATLALLIYIFAEPKIFAPKPELTVDITAKNGILEGSPLEYKTRGRVQHAAEPETFYIKITNEGNVNAHDVVIKLDVNNWMDFNNVAYGPTLIPCPGKTSECRIGVLPAQTSESAEFYVTIRPEDYDKVLNATEIPAITFKVTYDELSKAIEIPIKLTFWP